MNIYAMKKPKRVNAVSVTVTIIVLIIAYLLWFAIPVWWPSFQMGGIMQTGCNEAYRILDDEELVDKLVQNARRTGLRITEDNFRFTRVKFTPDELTARNQKSESFQAKRGKLCVIEFYYEDDYEWPLIGKTTHIVFEKKIEGDLTQVEW